MVMDQIMKNFAIATNFKNLIVLVIIKQSNSFTIVNFCTRAQKFKFLH